MRRRAGITIVALLAAAGSTLAPGAESPEVTRRDIPPDDVGAETLEARARAQLATRDRLRVEHDFGFTDRQPESGITFRNLITEDNRKAFKANHYDHSNGIAVADVDGDGLWDLYLLSQLGSNELYRNLGGGRFENVSEAAGVGLADRVSVSASFADYDNDGDPDLFVTTVKMGNVLFENDGRGRFTDVTARAGLAHRGHSSGSVFFDYDNDGRLDLLVTNVGVYTTDRRGPGGYYVGLEDAFQGHLHADRTEHTLLYRNVDGGTFREVSQEVGLVDGGWSGDAAFADLDGDRYPEVYILNMQGDDRYWVNEADGGGRRFVDRTARTFPRTPWGAMGVKFFDFNNDGRLDLYITDMHSDMSRPVGPEEETFKSVITWTDEHLQGGDDNIFGNALYENLGDGRFREVSDPMGVENYWPWGFSAADLNADGWTDLFVASSMSFPYRYGVSSVFLNERGRRFAPAEFILGVEPRRDGRTRIPWFELDCSGEDRDHFQCEGHEGRHLLTGTLGTRASVVFDLDGDGDLDIVTNEFYAEPQVLISDLAQQRQIRYLQVRLLGRRSNRDGLGATVRVHSGDRVLTAYHDGKSGYLSQSSLPLYFGLGDAARADRVEVYWPSGETQTVSEGIPANGLLEIEEPAAAAAHLDCGTTSHRCAAGDRNRRRLPSRHSISSAAGSASPKPNSGRGSSAD